jgi:hypothetical protein
MDVKSPRFGVSRVARSRVQFRRLCAVQRILRGLLKYSLQASSETTFRGRFEWPGREEKDVQSAPRLSLVQ